MTDALARLIAEWRAEAQTWPEVCFTSEVAIALLDCAEVLEMVTRNVRASADAQAPLSRALAALNRLTSTKGES